ncbi:purple acid phosphatase [Anaeramoeba flamelloides]|uniref:Purple acid phosphatase n=1 Tax=Anaeramoeba flamelloides TaxID=1746091 RepID=A0ABQ8Z4A0_9EUKA|nr:purple acid phosphatase [Anaeramoeba flamelloides]
MLFPRLSLLDNYLLSFGIAVLFFALVCVILQIFGEFRLGFNVRYCFKNKELRKLQIPYFVCLVLALIFTLLFFIQLSANDKLDPISSTFILAILIFPFTITCFFKKSLYRENLTQNYFKSSSLSESSSNTSASSSGESKDEKENEKNASKSQSQQQLTNKSLADGDEEEKENKNEENDENDNSTNSEMDLELDKLEAKKKTNTKTNTKLKKKKRKNKIQALEANLDLGQKEIDVQDEKKVSKNQLLKKALSLWLKNFQTFMSQKRLVGIVTAILCLLVCLIPIYLMEDLCLDPYDSGFSSTKPFRKRMESSCSEDKPCHIYLTVPDDLRYEMIVTFHTSKQLKGEPTVKYGLSTESDYTSSTTGITYEIEFDDKRWIHYVSLTGLTPNTIYRLIAGDSSDDTNWTDEKQFKTTPQSLTDDSLLFVSGGDTNVVEEMNGVTEEMAKLDPSFVIFGGDIALADGNIFCYRKWDKWFDYWDKYALSDGRSIPFIPIVGNHEVLNGYRYKSEPDLTFAPLFYAFFQSSTTLLNNPYKQKSYNSYRINNEVAVIGLDTNHIYTIEEQNDWIDSEFSDLIKDGVKHIFPTYHIPAYPSDDDYDVSKSAVVRENWCEKFEQYGVRLAFENHSHMVKKTVPIKNSKKVSSEEGVYYVGDGAWGRLRDSREGTSLRWYESFIASSLHTWIVSVNTTKTTTWAMDDKGENLTSLTIQN